MRCPLLSLAILLVIGLAAAVFAEWVFDARFVVDTGYTISGAAVLEDESKVIVGATDNAGSCIIYVLNSDLSLDYKYSVTGCDALLAFDYRNGYVAAVGSSGSDVVVYVIDNIARIVGSVTITSVGGSGYSVSPLAVAISGSYIYALVLDSYDNANYIYIIDTTPAIVGSISLGTGSAALSRAENSDYVTYIDTSGILHIADGSNGSLVDVYSIDIGKTSAANLRSLYDTTSNMFYAAIWNGNEVYLITYDPVNNSFAKVSLEQTIFSRSVSDVSKTTRGIYVTTFSGYGYLVADSSVTIESTPEETIGVMTIEGRDYVYSMNFEYVERYYLSIETVTVTTTTTVALPVYETETMTTTVVTTTTVGYETEDVAMSGVLAFVMGVALAYLLASRR